MERVGCMGVSALTEKKNRVGELVHGRSVVAQGGRVRGVETWVFGVSVENGP